MTEKTQDRLEITSPTFTGKIVVKGEKGLEELLTMVRDAWRGGGDVVIKDTEIRFEKE